MITVIIPVFNIFRRHLPGHADADSMKRVYYSLLSIASANNPPQVIISDGSTDKNFQRLHDLISEFPNVRHVHFPQGEMNLSTLWNQGIIIAETPYVLCTGIDFLYAPTYFDSLRAKADPGKIIISETLMCPPEWVPSTENITAWDMPEAKPNVAGELANGIQLFHKSWFDAGGGYDNQLTGWGAMDNQMVKRAKVYGLAIEWHREGEIYHIWHPAEKFQNQKSLANFNRNQRILRDTKGFRVN